MEELKITIPEGQEIDWQESAKQKKIVFRPKVSRPTSWEEYCDSTKHIGYYIDLDSRMRYIDNNYNHLDYKEDRNLLPTEKLAESFLALMQLMSLRQVWVGDWKPDWTVRKEKYCILFVENKPNIANLYRNSAPLSFPTKEMAKEFLECFKDLINEAKDLL